MTELQATIAGVQGVTAVRPQRPIGPNREGFEVDGGTSETLHVALALTGFRYNVEPLNPGSFWVCVHTIKIAAGEEQIPEPLRLTERELDRLAARAVYILRRIQAADPVAFGEAMGKYAALTSDALINDPTCQCGGLERAREQGITSEFGTLSPLGVLNGLFGVIPGTGYGRISSVWTDEGLRGIDLTNPADYAQDSDPGRLTKSSAENV